MALIHCTECGKDFSDKAPACPNCGCPTSIILEELKLISASEVDNVSDEDAENIDVVSQDVEEDVNSEKVKDIVACYDIFGFPYEIDVETDNFYRTFILLTNTRKEYARKMDEGYTAMKDFDGVMEKTPEFMAKMLDALLEMSVKLLRDAGIYEYNKNTFFGKYQENIRIDEMLSPLVEKYLTLEGQKQELNTYYDMLHESRKHTWVGGGIGVKGALAGYVQSSLMNAGMAFLCSFPDNTAKNKKLSKVDDAKKQAYNSKEARHAFRNAFLNIYDVCVNAVRAEMVDYGIWPDRNFYEKEALRRLKKVEAELISVDCSMDDVMISCAQAFDLAPVSVDVLDRILSLKVCGDEDVERFADDYGLLSAVKQKASARAKQEEEHRRKELKKRQETIRTEITSALEVPVGFNSTFFYIFELCQSLIKEGVTPDSVSTYITQAFRKRAEYTIKQEEYDEIIERISRDDIWTDFHNVKEAIESIREEELKREQKEQEEKARAKEQEREAKKCLKDACTHYAETVKDQYFTLNTKNTPVKDLEDIRKIEHYIRISSSVSYYGLYNSLSFDVDGRLKRYSSGIVIAFTDYGLYFCSSQNNCPIHVDWKELVKEDVKSSFDKLKIGSKKINNLPSGIPELVITIRGQLRAVFNYALGPSPDSKKRLKDGIEKKIQSFVEENGFGIGEDKYGMYVALSKHGSALTTERCELIKKGFANRIVFSEGLSWYCLYAPKAFYGEYETSSFKKIYCITNYGILWSESVTDENWIYWTDFLDAELNFISGSYSTPDAFTVNDTKFIFGKQSKSVMEWLSCIQKYLRSLCNEFGDLELLAGSGADLVPNMVQLFAGYEGVNVYSPFDDSFAKSVENNFPQEENNICYGIKDVKYVLDFEGTGTSLMITGDSLLVNDGHAVESIPISQMVSLIQNGENPTLSILRESSSAISFAIPELLSDEVLASMNKWIYRVNPYDHARCFAKGIGVKKDINKAIELYSLASLECSYIGKSYIAIGELLEEKELFVDAYTYYKKVLDIPKDSNGHDKAYYKLACLFYDHGDLHYGNEMQPHFDAVIYMDKLAKKKLFDAQEKLLRMINDGAWMEQVRAEADTKILREKLAGICENYLEKSCVDAESAKPQAKAQTQAKESVSSFLKRAGKSLWGRK